MKLPAVIFLALFALAMFLLGSARADAATLRPQIVVEGDVVLLGDIFDDAGPRAAQPVARAPGPGRRLTLEVAWLAEVARAYQVAWRPQSRFDRVVVERAGRIVTAAEVAGRIRAALAEVGAAANAVIELQNRALEFAIAPEAPATIDVRNLQLDAATGRFSATVTVAADSPWMQRAIVAGRAHPGVAVPVLRRALSPGEIIRDDDIDWLNLREDQVRRDVVTDQRRLVGTTPRSRLSAGQPVREQDTRAPVIVPKNGLVTIVIRYANMTLSAQGRSLEEGAKGDTIRVTNLQSNRVVEATVAGPELVTIQLAPRVQTALN